MPRYCVNQCWIIINWTVLTYHSRLWSLVRENTEGIDYNWTLKEIVRVRHLWLFSRVVLLCLNETVIDKAHLIIMMMILFKPHCVNMPWPFIASDFYRNTQRLFNTIYTIREVIVVGCSLFMMDCFIGYFNGSILDTVNELWCSFSKNMSSYKDRYSYHNNKTLLSSL